MKKDKEKAKYMSPQTRKIVVKLESSICAGSADIDNPNANSGKIEKHEVNTDFGFTLTDQEWDETGNF
ncbi:MAG TPA: hypothetical protein H9752_10410 [Candidatus Phocaeicola excrementigallinarum]|nr:hypothetical protein [Candidatus Phocaeicola excrementigallinarum]